MEHTREAEERAVTLTMLRSHVERCLQDIWDTRELVVDGDGDYPFRQGTAMGWVSVVAGPPPSVRVFAHAAHGLRRTAKLLGEVNDLNARSRWAKVAFAHGIVQVSIELPPAAVDRLTLAGAVVSVGEVADDVGGLLAAVFGGQTPLPAVPQEHDQNATEEAA